MDKKRIADIVIVKKLPFLNVCIKKMFFVYNLISKSR